MKLSIAFVMAVLVGAPAFAEIDLSGNWSTRQHQDLAGPESGAGGGGLYWTADQR